MAEYYYQRAIELDPKLEYLAENDLANLYLYLSQLDTINNDEKENYREKALDKYKYVTILDPDYKYAYNGWGDALKSIDPEEAIKKYNRAIQLDPNYSDPYKNLGDIHLSRNNHKNAIENCEKAISIDPYFSDAHESLSHVLQNVGRSKEADDEHFMAVRVNLETKDDCSDFIKKLGSRLNVEKPEECEKIQGGKSAKEWVEQYKNDIHIGPYQANNETIHRLGKSRYAPKFQHHRS